MVHDGSRVEESTNARSRDQTAATGFDDFEFLLSYQAVKLDPLNAEHDTCFGDGNGERFQRFSP